MSLRTENISLNCKKAYFQTIIENLHVGDVKSTQLVFTLTDGIKEIELPDGKTTAIIHGKKPDGTEIHNECTVENNKIYYTLTAQDTAVSGLVDYMLDVTVNRDEQYERAYMPTFRTRVSDRIYKPAYRVLETEPEHWERDYKNYYRKEGNAYIQIGDNVCPTFAQGTFYVLVDPPVESASEFLAFYSAFNKVSELFDKRLVIDSTTTDIEYSVDNIHKVFINATIGNGIKGVVFTAATGNQYAVCSDGLLRMRTYSGSYSDWNVVALNTVIDDSNKNKNNRVPSIKAVVDYIATAISGKADTADVNAALATKANKTYVDTELGKKADINHSHPVDSEFSQTSTNPIENRKVTEEFNKITKNVNTALAGKANVNHTHDMSNYVTLQAMITALANKADISDIPTVPTNVSAFNNDAGYITNSDIDLPGKANYREVNIENINNATNPNTVYRVSLGMNDGVPEYATIICPRSGDLSNLNHTQYAFTNLGRVLIRKCINGVWESSFTDLIPEGGGVTSYNDLTDKPSINNVTLSGNKSSDDLSLQGKLTAGNNIKIEGNVISAEGGVTDYLQLDNKPSIHGRMDLISWITTPIQGTILLNNEDFKVFSSSIPDQPSRDEFGINLSSSVPINYMQTNDSWGKYDFNSLKGKFINSGTFRIPVTDSINKPSIFEPFIGDIFITHYFQECSYLEGTKLIRFAVGTNADHKNLCFWQIASMTNEGNEYVLELNSNKWQELTGGGAQIISGVVNVNGTITFTDSEGNSFTTSGESVIGADGFSPSATVQQTASGATITVTDKNGTTTANISNGQDGNDYVLTAQDKSDIADIVLNELPTTEGVLYGNQSN